MSRALPRGFSVSSGGFEEVCRDQRLLVLLVLLLDYIVLVETGLLGEKNKQTKKNRACVRARRGQDYTARSRPEQDWELIGVEACDMDSLGKHV